MIVKDINIKGVGEEIDNYLFTQAFGKKVKADKTKTNMQKDNDKELNRLDRQISFMAYEAMENIKLRKKQGLCMKRFKGDIVTEGLNYENLSEGDVIELDDVRIRISQAKKRCHGESCPSYHKDYTCIMKKQVAFGRIESEGIISVDHEFKVKDKA